MEKLLLVAGIALLGCAVMAVGLYAWHGHWMPVFLTLAAAFIGKMALGFVELLLTPITMSLIYFAKHGNKPISFVLATLLSLISRAAFAAYCAAVLLYLVRTPGPPVWLAILLAVAIASAPFAWAAKQTPEDDHPSNLDLLAAAVGVAISGVLIALGVLTWLALTPIAILFFISALVLIFWWVAKGVPKIRFMHIIDPGAA